MIPDLINIHELVDVVITTLDARDPYTYEHSFRVAQYSELVSKKMNLARKMHDRLHIAAHLHDIGKIGVQDRILNKPGRLSKEEMMEIQTHPRIGYNILSRLAHFREIATIVLHHHERYDGKGYPSGLREDDIPIESRIISVADAFDAMTSDRPYRKGLPFEKAMEEIASHKGEQFDPFVVECFGDVFTQFTTTSSSSSDFNVDFHHAYAGHEDLMHSRIVLSDPVIRIAS